MSHPRPRSARPYDANVPRVLLPALLAALLLTGACGSDAETVASPEREPVRPSRTDPVRSPRPSATPTRAPAPASTRPAPRRDRQRDRKVATLMPLARANPLHSHLLTTRTLPHLGGHDWTVRTTGPEPRRPVGVCQKTPLADIGALEAVHRGFVGPDGAGISARQVVARFADARSAWRAHEVLVAWRDDCAERADRPGTRVGPLREVVLDSGAGDHYRSAHGTRPDRDTAGLGIHRRGPWLSVVVLTSPQVTYPRDWQPSRRAVRRIAGTFN